MNILIGIAGAKQSGKSTTARLFAEELPSYEYHEVAFADPLKLEICHALQITLGELELNKSRYRGLLQWWGTEYRREGNPNYWTDKWVSKVRHLMLEDPSVPKLIIAPDVRFENEYNLLKSVNVHLFRVSRTFIREDKHLSEVSLLNQSMISIDNNKDLEHLKEQVKQIVRKMKV